MSNKMIRASEIGQFSFCRYGYILLKEKGVSPQQTLQDLITENRIPPAVIRELEQRNIPLNTTIDKIIGQGIIPQKIEEKIIKNNIMLHGTAIHERMGETTQRGAMVQEHRGGYLLVLLLILMMIGFLFLLIVRGGLY